MMNMGSVYVHLNQIPNQCFKVVYERHSCKF